MNTERQLCVLTEYSYKCSILKIAFVVVGFIKGSPYCIKHRLFPALGIESVLREMHPL